MVAGYEALARFRDGDLERLPTSEVFGRARELGRAAALEAACLRAGLGDRDGLPSNCFLTVNVSPGLLPEPEIRAVWDDHPDLRGVIVELTERSRIDSYTGLEPQLDRLRGTGALIAVDDAGAGYAGLTRMLALRPALIKLDRELVSGIDRDEAKRALAEMIGGFAARIDSWLLAEGVETEAEYATIASLGIPLAQGYGIARPGPAWPELARALPVMPAPAGASSLARHVGEGVPAARSVAEAAQVLGAHPETRTVVLVDEFDRPTSVVDSESAALGVVSTGLRMNLDTPVREALLRAVTRDSAERYDPVMLTDSAGRYAGIARMERLITAALGGWQTTGL
ncbi:hypothetical protein GCM10009851_14730 [Herbiconiux moechotypicola]|uniref:EAL domain-containing protein n=1 Tax=Herbiconiux moechotypicola TaxID=637393 RepID=A0ABP5QBC2_9MICO